MVLNSLSMINDQWINDQCRRPAYFCSYRPDKCATANYLEGKMLVGSGVLFWIPRPSTMV